MDPIKDLILSAVVKTATNFTVLITMSAFTYFGYKFVEDNMNKHKKSTV